MALDPRSTTDKSKKSWYIVSGILIFLILILLNSACLNSTTSVEALRSKTQTAASPDSQAVKPFIPVADSAVSTGYKAGFTPGQTGGRGAILLDNTHNGFPVLAALYATTDAGAVPARVCTIRSGEQFIVSDLRPGKYEVRFRNLTTGKCFKLAPPVIFDENSAGTAQSGESPLPVELYDGPPAVTPISLSEFEPPGQEL